MKAHSSVLLINQRPRSDFSIGADYLHSLVEINHDYDVISLSLEDVLKDDFRILFDRLKKKSPWVQLVLLAATPTDPFLLRDSLQYLGATRIAESVNDPKLEIYLTEALEKAQLIKQNIELEKLVQEQNEKLKALYNSLEERVNTRQQYLVETKRKTLLAGARWEAIRHASMIIHQSSSMAEMERALTLLLNEHLKVSQVKILFPPQDEEFLSHLKIEKKWSHLFFSLGQSENSGAVLFLRDQQLPFNKEESDFLAKVSEVISLALDRLKKLGESKGLKEQWEATFNAVSEPIMMVKQNYEIMQTNAAFLSFTQNTASESFGRKCYQVLFGKDHPCSGCQMGATFRTEGRRGLHRTFEVTSQSVPLENQTDVIFFHQYSDITDQVKMEKKLLDSAKMAELGTIGSSIAHELNNPLGGLLSFTQLIKMDLSPNDPIYNDICALESGAQRCRDIVQNLLGFSRNPISEQEGNIDLRDALDRALRIAELQTKSSGIEIKLLLPPVPVYVHGHLNLLAQALQHLLQLIAQSFRLANDMQSHRMIEVKVANEATGPVTYILDNSPGVKLDASLDFSVAHQIIHEHGGSIEISHPPKQFRKIKIQLPRLDS